MDTWYTLIDTAEKLGIKVRTVRQWIRNGKLNAKKIDICVGRKWIREGKLKTDHFFGGQMWVVSESEIRRKLNEDESGEHTKGSTGNQ